MQRFLTRCSTWQIGPAIQEMQTDFVAGMLRREADNYTPEGQERIHKYARIMEIAPPPDWQLENADAFDQKAGITEYTVDYVLAVKRGILTGIGAPPDVVAQVKEQRKLLKVQIENGILASIILTYNGVKKADLAKYGDELSTGPLKWYFDTVHKSFVEILLERSTAVGRDIKDAVLASREAAQ
jgi:hypothetical protein